MSERPTAAGFVADALRNPGNAAVLEVLPDLALPDAWLVAGCLFQTVWNLRVPGRDPAHGIKDYDLFYFDATDLSAQAEQAVQRRVDQRLQGLGLTVEVANQARVHTWYERDFGHPYAALGSSRDGIARFLVPCTCVGLQAGSAGIELFAPYGLDELYAGLLRPNPLLDHRDLFRAKAASYQARWPWLQIRETP